MSLRWAAFKSIASWFDCDPIVTGDCYLLIANDCTADPIGSPKRVQVLTADQFDKMFDALEKGATRTRSVYYVFVLINVTIFLYCVNAFIFSIPRERAKMYTDLLVCELNKINSPHCDHLRSMGVNSKLDKVNSELKEIQIAGIKHRQDTYLDEQAANRRFTFPLFGVSIDIDYFWLMHSIVGLLSYFVLMACLNNEAEIFEYMLKWSDSDVIRLRLILSTQVLSSPVDYRGAEIAGFSLFIKGLLTNFILLIPVTTAIISILYFADLLEVVEWPFSVERYVEFWRNFSDEVESHGMLVVVSLSVQVLSAAIMARIYLKIREALFDNNQAFRSAVKKIGELESGLPATSKVGLEFGDVHLAKTSTLHC